MIDHEPDRNEEQNRANERETRVAYRSIYRRLGDIRATEVLRDKRALQRTGVINPVKGSVAHDTPLVEKAMNRLWEIGVIDDTGRADTELRRAYHLISKGRAPITESDLIELGQIPEKELRALLPWLAHRTSLKEARDCVAKGEIAPPIVMEETC